MEYIDPQQARDMPGLRLVLTAGVPGPWSEAAKAVFQVKGVDFVPVRQVGGQENAELRAWTGRDNAPIAIQGDEPPRDGWADILSLAERLAPKPGLVPEDLVLRAQMFGLAHLICGPGGFAWERRHQLFGPIMAMGPAGREAVGRMAGKYAWSEEASAAAPARVAAILRHLADQLSAQAERGSPWFVGDEMTAVDLYWATFCAMLEPLPEEQCPMPTMLRQGYLLDDPAIRSERDAILLDHRDRIYREVLPPPDF